MVAKAKTATMLKKLAKLASGEKRALIIMQNNPDPDAIASAAALKLLLKEIADCESSIIYGGVIGRAENRSMLKYLGTSMRSVAEAPIEKYDIVAMVDTQPGFGNNPISDHSQVDIVIDHHEVGMTEPLPLWDIRPYYGATSTILTEYLLEARITPPIPLATALAYGIQSDTQDLGRETSGPDIDMYTYLYPIANKRLLGRIENEQEPREYFTVVSRALREARTYGGVGICWLGRTINPDMTGEIADFLMRCEEINWVLVTGLYQGTLYISLRSDLQNADADSIMRKIVNGLGTGGGHEMIAGGQIDIERDSTKIADKFRRKIEQNLLTHFDVDPKNRRLLVSRAGERVKV